MTSFARSGSTLRARYSIGLLALVAMFPLGCSNMTSTATQSASPTSQVRIKGRVHGGNQPVSGATVSVYFAGQSGYGSASTLATQTTTANDGYGSFSFTVSCPVQPNDPLVYLVARGGNTLNNGSSSNNSAAEFLAAVTPCTKISSSTFVDMSEVTTVATMAALQQYYNPTTQSFGVDGILLGYNAMVNAFYTIPNLVDAATGTAVTTLTKTATASGGSVSVTVTPETAKINTLANIISACINNNANGDATACSTLESNATPPATATTSQPGNTLAPATDVLNALYYIMTNPTNGGASNLNTIYGLAPGTGAPYQPTLSSAPSDWTIGVTYSSTSNCTNGDGFFNKPSDLKLDSSGNVWIANSSAAGNLSELRFEGTPTSCTAIANQSVGSTIDDQGNVWVGSSATPNIYRYTPGTGAVLTFGTSGPVQSITADGNHNVYYSSFQGTSLYAILGGATATVASAPTLISGSLGGASLSIMVDSSGGSYLRGTNNPSGTGAVWVTSNSGVIYEVTPSSNTSDATFQNGFVTASYPVSGNSIGVSLVPGNAGNVFVSGRSPDYINLLSPSGGTYVEATHFPASGGGLSLPSLISADGARNIWILSQPSGGASSVSEFTNGAVALSPSTGFVKSGASFAGGRSIIVDQGGNVWISGTFSNTITEIIGAGVPIYQPASIGIAQGRFQTLP